MSRGRVPARAGGGPTREPPAAARGARVPGRAHLRRLRVTRTAASKSNSTLGGSTPSNHFGSWCNSMLVAGRARTVAPSGGARPKAPRRPPPRRSPRRASPAAPRGCPERGVERRRTSAPRLDRRRRLRALMSSIGHCGARHHERGRGGRARSGRRAGQHGAGGGSARAARSHGRRAPRQRAARGVGAESFGIVEPRLDDPLDVTPERCGSGRHFPIMFGSTDLSTSGGRRRLDVPARSAYGDKSGEIPKGQCQFDAAPGGRTLSTTLTVVY